MSESICKIIGIFIYNEPCQRLLVTETINYWKQVHSNNKESKRNISLQKEV